MGGTGIAMRDNNSVYFLNPASYTSIDTTSFIFDFGFDWGLGRVTDGTETFKTSDFNFSHLLMGFPVSKKIGVATGLVPVSNGYYYISNVVSSGDPEYDALTGGFTSIHRGTGTLNSYFLGVGGLLTKKLSAGINAKVLFGQLDRLNQFEFEDLANFFNQRSTESLRISGIVFNYGLQYTNIIKKNYFVTAGLSYDNAKRIKNTHNVLVERFTAYPTSLYSPDTLLNISTTSKDSTRLPSSVKLGLSFGKKDKFVVEVNYSMTFWSDSRLQGSNGTLANSTCISAGLEYIPEKYSNVSALKRIEYRVGAHYGGNYLILNGHQVKEYGLSCGLGIRMTGSRIANPLSKATIFFDYTRRQGDLSIGMPNEDIFSIGASLNLYDFWFFKRRYE